MIYLYDKAIVNDLRNSFNPKNVPDPVVKIIDPEGAVSLAAQIQNDEIKFPVVALFRDLNTPISDTMNFTRKHFGVDAAFDKENNIIYQERAIPIDLRYDITVLTTNLVDRDEIMRELMFKYSHMYFLTIQLPYECDRKIRFGIALNDDNAIESKSGTFENIQSGTLYQTILHLHCDGCVLVSYRKKLLERMAGELQIDDKHI